MNPFSNYLFIKRLLPILFLTLLSLIIPTKKVVAGMLKTDRAALLHLGSEISEAQTLVAYHASYYLKNLHTIFAVTNIRIDLLVINLETQQTIWNQTMNVNQMPPSFEKQFIVQGNPVIIPKQGEYELRVTSFAENDVTPDDNTSSFYFSARNVLPDLPFDLSLEQIDFYNPFQQINSTAGFVNIGFDPVPGPLFLNMNVRRTDFPSPIWLVQNFPLLPFHTYQEISIPVDFGRLGFSDGENIQDMAFSWSLTEQLLENGFASTTYYVVEVGNVIYNVQSDNNTELTPLHQPESLPEINWSPSQPITWHFRGCDVPNVDLDSSLYNPINCEGYAGDWNACGSAATANSMQWLEDSHPKIKPNGQSLREKMLDLSSLMNRGNEKGVTTDQIVEAKLAYIDKHRLPIHVKYQSHFLKKDTVYSPDSLYGHYALNKTGSGGKPDFNWIRDELLKGEDVEILFGWYDRLGNRHGGHWVNLTGVSDVGTGKGFYFKDDVDQSKEGGARQMYVNWVEDDEGWSRLVGFKGPNSFCWVESAISESYDSTITHDIEKFKVELFKRYATDHPDMEHLAGVQHGGTFILCYSTFDFFLSDKVRYLNVNMKNANGIGDTWLLRNVLLPPFFKTTTLSVWSNLEKLGYTLEDAFRLSKILFSYSVTDDPVETKPEFDNWQYAPVEVIPYRKDITTEENQPSAVLELAPIAPLTRFGRQKEWLYRGCTVPNIDLDAEAHNPDTEPGYAGDWKACGPAAAANSMQWLEDTDPNIVSGISHREKLKELSKMMKRLPEKGVYRENFIKAKLEYIDKYKLPVKVKFQGFVYGTDSIASPDSTYGHFAENKNTTANQMSSWKFLVQEMKDNEDVEVEFGYYEDGIRKGGHWVTVVGVSENEHYKGFYFKDDTDQDSTGGLREQYVNWSVFENYPYLEQISTDKYTCYVESIVSESYDSTITFQKQGITFSQLDWRPTFESGTTLSCQIGYIAQPSELTRFITLFGSHISTLQPVLLLENMIIPPVPVTQYFGADFDLGLIGISEGEIISSLELNIYISNNCLTEEDHYLPGSFGNYPVSKQEVHIGLNAAYPSTGVNDPSETWDYSSTTGPPPSLPKKPVSHSFEIRGSKDMRCIDLDYSTYPEDDEYAGDWGACAPAATAASMHWLEKKHPLHINTGLSPREKLVELSAAMNRKDTSGVFFEEIVNGKLRYIQNNKLPVKVKFQCKKVKKNEHRKLRGSMYNHYARNDNEKDYQAPTFAWLKNEIDHGEDVELGYEANYVKNDVLKRYAHAITITGYFTHGDKKGIFFMDDLDQKKKGGIAISGMIEHMNYQANWLEFNDFTVLKTRNAEVVRVISESYDSTVHYQPLIHEEQFRILRKRFQKKQNKTTKYEFELQVDPQGKKYLSISKGAWFDSDNTILFNLPISQKGTIIFTPEFEKFLREEGMLKSAKQNDSTITLAVSFTSYPIKNNTYADYLFDIPLVTIETTWPEDALEPEPIHPGFIPSFTHPLSSKEVETYEVSELPSYDLTGQINAGGIASAVSGMMWLNDKSEELSQEIIADVLFTLIDQKSGRSHNSGINATDLIKAKLATIDSLKIPIKLEFQSYNIAGDVASPDNRYLHAALNKTNDATPRWEWIKEKLNNNHYVIIGYGIYSHSGERLGGQWSTVSGYLENEEAKGLFFDLDNDQENPGGITTICSYWFDTPNYSYLGYYTADSIVCRVESAIAGHYDNTLQFIPVVGINKTELTDLNLKVIRNPSSKNEEITIMFASNADENVTISIFDLKGSLVWRKQYTTITDGWQSVRWNGKDTRGKMVGTGAYLVNLQAGNDQSAFKIIRE